MGESKKWVVAGMVSMLVLLSVAVFQMIVGGLAEKIVFFLYGIGLSEGTAQTAGGIVFGGLLIVSSAIVLLTVGVLLWREVAELNSESGDYQDNNL